MKKAVYSILMMLLMLSFNIFPQDNTVFDVEEETLITAEGDTTAIVEEAEEPSDYNSPADVDAVESENTNNVVNTETVAQQKEPKDEKDEISTLFGKSKSIGGYGSISIAYSEIDKMDGMIFGAKGGIVFGHSFTLGFGGSGFINDTHYDAAIDEDVSLAGGYGGLFFEPILLPKFPVHISIPIMLGTGGIAYTIKDEYNTGSWEEDNYYIEDSDFFFVLEPGVEVEFNVVKYFRFCIGAYYRYTTDIDLLNTDKDVLNGLSYGISFKFGKF